jgi:hypothetical protein
MSNCTEGPVYPGQRCAIEVNVGYEWPLFGDS